MTNPTCSKSWVNGLPAKIAGFYSRSTARPLSLVQSNSVDVIVSDIHMPVTDGVTMLEKIKLFRPQLPSVIFITGYYDIAPREAYELGVVALFSKPIERKELVSTVSRILTPLDSIWSLTPADKAEAVLPATFESLASALDRGLLAFGRGGFCIYSTLQFPEGPVDLQLDFQAEQRKVTGRGIVRWSDFAEAQIGIEFTYPPEDARSWILSLTEPNLPSSFIPRSSLTEHTLARHAPL